MSATYPKPCQNQTCGQPLYGPVRYCPFCASKQPNAAPAVMELSIVAESSLTPAPPQAADKQTPPAASSVRPSATPPAPPRPAPQIKRSDRTTPTAATEREKSIYPSPAVWGISLLLILAGAFFYRMTFHSGKIDVNTNKEPVSAEHKMKVIEEGYDCLQQKDYACAIARAEIVLDVEPGDKQAKKLLKEAKTARDSQAKEPSTAEIEWKVLLDNMVAAAKECIAQHDAPCARRNIEDLTNKAPTDPRLPNLNYLAAKDCGEQHDSACLRVNIDELRDRSPKDKHLADLDKLLVRLEYEKARGPLDNPPADDKSNSSASTKDATEKPATKLMAAAQAQLAKGDYEAAIATANAAKLLEPDNQLIDVFIEQAKQARDGKPK